MVLPAIAALAWQLVWRTQPDRVGPRFVEALFTRHPGTTVGEWKFGRLPVTMASGVEAYARLIVLFDERGSHRLGRGAAIARALALTMQALTTAASRPRVLACDPDAADGSTLSYAKRKR